MPDIKDNEFIVALIGMGAILHKKNGVLIASGLEFKEDEEGGAVYRGESYIHPKYFGFDTTRKGKEIHFTATPIS